MNKSEKGRKKSFFRFVALTICIAVMLLSVIPVYATSETTVVAGKTENMLTAVYAFADCDVSLTNAVYVTSKSDTERFLTDRIYGDGKVKAAGTLPDGWAVFAASDKTKSYTVTVTLDMGYTAKSVSNFFLRAYKSTSVGADMPTSVKFYVSENGSSFSYVGAGTTMTDLSQSIAAAVYGYTASKGYSARYIRAVLTCNGSKSLYLNEVGAAERSNLFRANYSYGKTLRDAQGLVYKIENGSATVTDALDGSYDGLSKITPSTASFDTDGLEYTLGVGSDNEVTVKSDFIGEGRPNYSGVPNNIKYIVIHNTGTIQESTDAERYNYRMHTLTDESSWHYTVDDEEIYHSLADSIVGWHAGSLRNYESIGIEICVNGAPADASGNFLFSGTAYNNWVNNRFRKSIKNAAILTAELLTRYGLDTDAVIQHYDVTGKNCPMWMRANGGSFVYEGPLWKEFMGYVEQYYLLMNGYSVNTEYTAQKSIVIPDHIALYGGEVYPVTAIAPFAFSDKGEFLQSITLGRYVNSIGSNCFENSDGLKTVKIASGNSSFTVDSKGVVKDTSGKVVFDPDDSYTSLPPAPKEGCDLDIREIDGRYYVYIKQPCLAEDIINEYGASTYRIVSQDGEVLTKYATVSTGASLRFGDCKLYIIHMGDIDGNATIDPFDYVMVKRYYHNSMTPSRCQLNAAVISNGKSVTSLDYLYIKRHVMKTYNIHE